MNTKVISYILTIALSLGCLPCPAQFDDNKTFYQRMDGGMTVVDPDRNMFGNTEYKVRSYDSRDSAYQSEYAGEILAIQLGALVVVGAINLAADAAQSLKEWWNNDNSTSSRVYPVITSIYPSSIAEGIGLQPGDYVISYNGKSLGYATPENHPLLEARNEASAQNVKECEITILRNGTFLQGTVPGGAFLGVNVSQAPIKQ